MLSMFEFLIVFHSLHSLTTNIVNVKRTIFLAPVIVKYLEKNLDTTKPRYSEHILPVP